MTHHLVVTKAFSYLCSRRYHRRCGKDQRDSFHRIQEVRHQSCDARRVERLVQVPISQQGSINTTSLIVPDLYVQIVPPQNLVLNGVPTNILGVVGTASWGPVDEPAIVATMADYAQQFGSIVPRKYDMGTQVATAVQQGAQNFRCVRVTDGTDAAASTAVPGTNASFTAIYTGSLGQQHHSDTRRRYPTQHLDAVGPSCRGSCPRFTTGSPETVRLSGRDWLPRSIRGWGRSAGHPSLS